MTYTKDSALVKVWVGLVMAGVYRIDQIPTVNNLKVVVEEVVSATAGT